MKASFSPLRNVLIATSLTLATLAATPAHAFADDDARRAILELRQQLKQTTEQNQQARFQLADQVETLRQELTNIRGELEKVRFELDVNKRTAQTQAGSSPQVGNPQEQAAFDKPMNLFRTGKYKEAATEFGSFLTSYPTSQLAADATFYQGSSLYASKDFKGAIQGLQGLVQSNPTDPRAADALLIVAASQIEANNMAGAKASLQRIVKEYPQTNAAETAKSRLKLLQ